MKASFQWLRALLPALPGSPKELAAKLTGGGLEVEGLSVYGAGIEACEVVAVRSVRAHPGKAGLRLVTVDRGGGASLEVVCGAPNVPESGGLVVLAPLGTHLPAKGVTIEKRSIAGVDSVGMLCSEQELGLTDDGEGILVLPAGLAAPGTRFVDAVPEAQDTVLEIGLTPNRPDGLGHIGLAREAAALYGLPFAMPAPEACGATTGGRAADHVRITIEDPAGCPHYGAAVVTGVRVGPSPLGVRYRLAALGVRPISNLVDVTNLVLLGHGHPMHAFDLDKVRGGLIVVRRARAGEKLRTLDGVDRMLDPDDLVICDGGGPVALAGVMGGAESEIGEGTRRVLLECAYFDPRTVRRAAKRHGIHSESSHRFERGVDHGDTPHALAHAKGLVTRLAGGEALATDEIVTARALARPVVPLASTKIDALLGVAVPWDDALAILHRLGFEVRASGPGRAECVAPTHRPDVGREVDLIEEVLRVRGLDVIPAILPAIRPSRAVGGQDDAARRARAAAVSMGMLEAVTFGFTSARALAAARALPATVVLENPLSETHAVMRTSLLPGLLEAVARAQRHGERDVSLFTVGRVFLAGKAALPAEPLGFAAVIAGDRRGWLEKPVAVDVWDAKGAAVGLVERLARRAPEVQAFDAPPPHLHPRGAARLVLDGVDVGRFGLLHPDVGDAFELGPNVAVVEVELESLVRAAATVPSFRPIPRFPASLRDVALVVKDDVPAGDVETAVRAAAGDLAERVEIFDRFVGGSIPAGHASLAFHVVYRAAERTLTDAEVDARHAQVVQEVGRRFGATLRS